MAAYVIADIEVIEPVEYEEYKKLAGPTAAMYGGQYIARGGEVEVAEGEWQPRRLVILQFPSMAQARAWYHSPEYAPAKEIRQRTARSNLILAEGLPLT